MSWWARVRLERAQLSDSVCNASAEARETESSSLALVKPRHKTRHKTQRLRSWIQTSVLSLQLRVYPDPWPHPSYSAAGGDPARRSLDTIRHYRFAAARLTCRVARSPNPAFPTRQPNRRVQQANRVWRASFLSACPTRQPDHAIMTSFALLQYRTPTEDRHALRPTPLLRLHTRQRTGP